MSEKSVFDSNIYFLIGSEGEMGDTTTVGGNSSSGEAVMEEVSRLVEQARELQDSAASLISRTSRDEDSLRQRANSLNSNIQRIHSSIRKSNLDSKHVEKVIKN